MAPIDLDRLRLRPNTSALSRLSSTRSRRSGLFLKGPIPLSWLTAAARLPGKSLHVGLALWFASGLQRSRRISLSNLACERFGLDRNAKYRGLVWLEEAGLIAVERKLGRAPIVTILYGDLVPPEGP